MQLNTAQVNNARYAIPFEWDRFTRARVHNTLDLIEPCETVLDLGCYDGTIMELMEDKANKIVGADNADSAIAACRKKGLEVKKVDTVESLPFDTGSFDGVLAGEIIEHLYDVNKFLNEVNRVLSPGGQFIVSTPNLSSIGTRLGLLFGITPWMIENEIGGKNAGHLRYFTFKTLRQIVEKHGFTQDATTTDTLSLTPTLTIVWRPWLKPFTPFGRNVIAKFIKK